MQGAASEAENISLTPEACGQQCHELRTLQVRTLFLLSPIVAVVVKTIVVSARFTEHWVAGFTRIISFHPQTILYRQVPFLQMRGLRFRKVENLPSVRWLASDRARLLGCWASSYLSFTLSISSWDFSGTPEGWPTLGVLLCPYI